MLKLLEVCGLLRYSKGVSVLSGLSGLDEQGDDCDVEQVRRTGPRAYPALIEVLTHHALDFQDEVRSIGR